MRTLFGHARDKGGHELSGHGLSGTFLDRLFSATSGEYVGLERAYGGEIFVWSQISGTQHVRARLDNDDPTQRMSWRKTEHTILRSNYVVSDLTLSGSWSQLNSTGSGVTDSYLGNRGAQTVSSGAYAEVSVSRPNSKPYDVWIVYTQRTSGAYARVDIDGSQDLVTEISDPASLGFKAFSTVGAVDLKKKNYKLVARNLTGAHTVRITWGGAASGNNLLVEGVSISADLTDAKIMPPVWQPSTSYTFGDEVQLNGIYYSARATATSDSGSGPTHTSGIASDGTMDWIAWSDTTYQDFVTIDYASEKEYATQATFGATSEDIGGQTHMSETLGARSITVDGVSWSESGAWATITTGAEIVITETTTWVHPSDPNLAAATLVRTYTPGTFSHSTTVVSDTGGAFTLGWLYPAMMTIVRWDGARLMNVFTEIVSDEATNISLDDYSGATPADVSLGASYRVGAIGAIGDVTLGHGLKVTPSSVLNYTNTGAEAFLRPNVNAASASGGTDWQVKLYFGRATAANPEPFTNPTTLQFDSEHTFRVI